MRYINHFSKYVEASVSGGGLLNDFALYWRTFFEQR